MVGTKVKLMNLVALFVLVSMVLCKTTAKYFASQLELYKGKYPNRACAVFKHRPFSDYTDRIPRSWNVHYKCTVFRCFDFVICIPKVEHGAWLRRDGDGGFENWIFDRRSYRREGDKITVR
ncbi:hypothetical protein DSO57_1037178 [Entomophthora muscae]|uniref:Uncharacterized protein n=1 Tax=Entomophthora muscae TaxID=34485 RepID=A0ACC2SC25_9FUNG|nr:hypothetical protein DSO57_1037178 [Entomophthora muscae]